ncbi:MAG: hypothetical protein LBM76_01835 [Mycoplasmataceae bacterium]|nr:hypothetical protein [Mycoplasmataceae bacterium]
MNESLNVVEYFENTLIAKNKQIVEETLDSLIKSAGVNEEKNKETVAEIDRLDDVISKINSASSQKKTFLVLCFILLPLIFIWLPLYFHAKNKHNALLSAEGAQDVSEVIAKRDKEVKTAYEQVNPLLNLIQTKLIMDIIEKTTGFIKFDDFLSEVNKKEFAPKISFNDNESVQSCLSLSLFKNAAVIIKKLEMSTYMHTWYGTASYRDSKGNTSTRMISTSLPAPKFSYETTVAIKNDIAESLNFNNYDKAKKLLPLEVREFNKRFPCWRNDEAQFRMLFTVLAQEEMLKVLDVNNDFIMEKDGKITTVTDTSSALDNNKPDRHRVKEYLRKGNDEFMSWNNSDNSPKISLSATNVYHYDLATIKENFIQLNESAFKDIYYMISPIIVFPAYQHFGKNKPLTEKDWPSEYYIEGIINDGTNIEYIKPNINTQHIIKVSFVKDEGKCAKYNIECKGYHAYRDVIYQQGGSINVIRFSLRSNNHVLYVIKMTKKCNEILVDQEINQKVYKSILSKVPSFIEAKINNNFAYVVSSKPLTPVLLTKITSSLHV